jgi:hypothetical protein
VVQQKLSPRKWGCRARQVKLQPPAEDTAATLTALKGLHGVVVRRLLLGGVPRCNET